LGVRHWKNVKLLLPVVPQCFEGPVHVGGIGVLYLNFLTLRARPHPHHEDHPRLLAGRQGQPFVQRSAVIAPQLRAVAALPTLHRDGITLCAIAPQEAVTQAVVTVGIETRREVVERPRLVKEIVFDDPVLVARSAGIQAHLEILIVDLDMVEQNSTYEKTLSSRAVVPVFRMRTSQSSTSSSSGMKTVCSA
jgi:hypothetical protein